MVGDLYQILPAQQKAPYKKEFDKEMARYEKEFAKFEKNKEYSR